MEEVTSELALADINATVEGDCVYDEYNFENDRKRLVVSGNGSADMLNANCGEFDRSQWVLIVEDRANKEIAIAMRDQGAALSFHGDAKNKDEITVSQRYLHEKGILYVQQRNAIIEKLERGHEAKRDKDKKLSASFPAFVAPKIVDVQIRVTCQVQNAAPKTKKIKIKREEGTQSLLAASVDAHTGLSKKKNFVLKFAIGDITVSDDNIMDLDNDVELRLQEQVAAPVKEDPKKKKVTGKPEKAAQASSAPVESLGNAADKMRFENSLRLVSLDVGMMVIPISQNMNFHEKMSLLSYMVYWAAYTLNGLNLLLKDGRSNLVKISERDSIDCLMSLQRAIRDMSSSCPEALVNDAKAMDVKLRAKFAEMRLPLLNTVTDQFPELIDKTSYDQCTPKINRLYDEQARVISLLFEKISRDEPCLIGYRVPPSGGKTILSVAIASMIKQHFSNSKKRLLYVCYNTLVRMSVANACEQSAIPFWVATTGKSSNSPDDESVVATSWSCRDRSRHALREAKNKAIAQKGSHKKGGLLNMWDEAQSVTIHHNPIVIADITSALTLINRFPDDFIVYLDEPTAGAENGVEENEMQIWMTALISKLPKQAVLLSATLPNLKEEMPSLNEKYGSANIVMVETQRLPVGSVAISPDGRQVLPHQMANSWEEFKDVIRGLQNDALMLRFYTPNPVHQIASVIEKLSKDVLPSELKFNSVITNIGDLSHRAIRSYAQALLQWVAKQESELGTTLFDALKTIVHARETPQIVCETFITDHVASEGRALAVTTPNKIEGEDYETLDELIAKAMSPYIDKIPDVESHIRNYLTKKAEYTKQYDAYMKAAGKDPEAANKAEELEVPEFGWPVQVAGFSAVLTDHEIAELDGITSANLLSGLGRYDPSKMSDYEQSVVMREASHGHLACLFSTPDIVYGTNMSLIIVFIGTGYGKTATRNSLYQLIGRAGRTGRSHKAKILFQDEATMRKALLPEPAGRNFEAEVMEWHLKNINIFEERFSAFLK